ncbi:methyltransferase [Candidatus Pacearchaeota archaeon]|nr:methyltransferase [Candidatus Pacearchaeota archaeon]
MARELTQAAQAAKMIREEMKKRGLKCSVRSKTYSMGSNVNVVIYNQPPAVRKEVEKFADRFQYGDFDGMTDSYNYRKSTEDIPQAKHVFVENKMSDSLQQKAWEFLRNYWSGGNDTPEDLKDCSNIRLQNEWVTTLVYRLLRGSTDGSDEFWEAYQKPVPETVTEHASNQKPVPETHVNINKEKNGVEIFFDGKPPVATRTLLKENGWRFTRFSSCWYNKNTPKNLSFALLLNKETEPTNRKSQKRQKAKNVKKPKTANPDKFRTLAADLQSTIDGKFADRLQNTPKRVKQANCARLDGHRLERTQTVLYKLADMMDAGEVPEILQGIKSKKDIFDLMGAETAHVQNGYHGYFIDRGKPHQMHKNDPVVTALWSLLTPKTPEQEKAEKLEREIKGLQFSNIPGYFPTPENIIEKMLSYADIKDGNSILEPSAGSGAIADKIKEQYRVNLHCCECNYTLRDILKAKGYDVGAEDFLNYLAPGVYDKIIMNPPFENRQDINHIKHALMCLKRGGTLVALCGGGPRQLKELQPISDVWEELPSGSFKESGTMVGTVLLVING